MSGKKETNQNDSADRRVDSFMLISLAVGAALMASFSYFHQFSTGLGRLVLTMGLGTVLGALGSTATFNHKPFVVAGGAALGAFCSFLLGGLNTADPIKAVNLDDLPRNASVMAAAGSKNIHTFQKRGITNRRKTAVELALSDRHWRQGLLKITIDVPKDLKSTNCINPKKFEAAVTNLVDGKLVFEKDENGDSVAILDGTGAEITKITECFTAAGDDKILTFECVDSSLIKKELNANKDTVLNLITEDQYTTGTLKLGSTIIAQDSLSVGDEYCKEIEKRVEKTSKNASFLNLGYLNALLQKFTQVSSLLGSMTAYAAAPADIKFLIEDLQSSISHIRRDARTQLAEIGLEAVEPMMAAFEKKGKIYRTRLGVLVATSSILKSAPDKAGQVSKKITDNQLRQIVRYAGDKDQTIRRYSQQVISRLGDPRAREMITQSLSFADEEATAELLKLLKDQLLHAKIQGNKIPRTTSDELTRAIDAKDTNKKFRQITQQIQTIARSEAIDPNKVKYFVVTGAFSTSNAARSWAKQINNKKPPQPAMVVQPKNDKDLYRVVVGDYIPRSDATKLKSQLLESGIVGSAFISNYPYSPM